MLIALEEMQRVGHSYATQVIANAKQLAKCLHGFGLAVVGEQFGFTETHQVWVRIGNAEEALRLVRDRLNPAGLRANNIQLPGERGAHGLRLGTSVLTRRGLKESNMEEVAMFFKRIILNKESPPDVRKDVREFLTSFPLSNLSFCLPAEEEAELVKRINDQMKL